MSFLKIKKRKKKAKHAKEGKEEKEEKEETKIIPQRFSTFLFFLVCFFSLRHSLLCALSLARGVSLSACNAQGVFYHHSLRIFLLFDSSISSLCLARALSSSLTSRFLFLFFFRFQIPIPKSNPVTRCRSMCAPRAMPSRVSGE